VNKKFLFKLVVLLVSISIGPLIRLPGGFGLGYTTKTIIIELLKYEIVGFLVVWSAYFVIFVMKKESRLKWIIISFFSGPILLWLFSFAFGIFWHTGDIYLRAILISGFITMAIGWSIYESWIMTLKNRKNEKPKEIEEENQITDS
jgi:hypothetical protein